MSDFNQPIVWNAQCLMCKFDKITLSASINDVKERMDKKRGYYFCPACGAHELIPYLNMTDEYIKTRPT